ncbi:folate-binding protein YgfZ [Microbacterium sp. MPKO10]|uniref:CAF17-like 4Fe-4S cluster assembly/insertion protein YgfZ n=1 Tax=Microbacterium sp. MPKO10 TaxID=2989818 RepID=UPI0022358CFE|nr:folate-binding protein [Microbacterium sp. MPKO10]MCW4458534.1 folate-binding protein [Microbacterium sp. MPKO10]
MSTSPFLNLPGAIELPDAADHGVPSHYGSPNIEQRALERGDAIVDLSSRAVVAITGPDRRSWVNSLASQAVADLAPGVSTEALFLGPQGRLEHAVGVIDDGETLWLLAEPTSASALIDWLSRMVFTLRVEVTDRTADFARIGVVGDTTELPAAAPADVPLRWDDPWGSVLPGGWQYASDEEHPSADWRWSEVLVERSALPALAARVRSGELRAAGSLAAEALRVAAWRPRQAMDADEKTIPHELDWLRTAVHLHKGCYRGQETVAKVHNLGRPPRRLVMLHLDGSESVLPAHGAAVLAPKGDDEREVGQITTAVMHHELGPVALAVIKRAVPEDLELIVLDDETRIAAAQEIIVPPGAGATADVPRLPRLGARTRPGR